MKYRTKTTRVEGLFEYPPILRILLLSRGITTRTEAETFLYGDYASTAHDPYLLGGMEAAVTRIRKAIADNEHILIYNDYDMDGIPGAVIVKDFFKAIKYDRIHFVTPHRNEDGFGLHTHLIDEAIVRGNTLIITIDCGIADVEAVAYARGKGIDVIITDHHLPHDTLPDAMAIVNPNMPGDEYPNKALCGAGVAQKLVEALAHHFPIDSTQALDMAGAATLSDMVSLVGENRALAKAGLAALRRSNRIGFSTLLRRAGIKQTHFSEDDLSFLVAPRINAASRMDRADIAFELLATDDAARAEELVKMLEALNDERKTTVALMVKDAVHRLSLRDEIPDAIVIGDPRWKPGLAGLVAQSLLERYGKPVFVWGRDGESTYLRGSCRSKAPVDIPVLLSSVSEIVSEGGGHTHSGGFGIEQARIHELEPALVTAVQNMDRATGSGDAVHEVDAVLSIDDASWDVYRQIEGMAPFGVGNPKPLFAFQGVVPKRIEHFGKEGIHLRIVVQASHHDVSAIAFFKKSDSYAAMPDIGKTCTIIGHLEESFFKGVPELRIRILDIVS